MKVAVFQRFYFFNTVECILKSEEAWTAQIIRQKLMLNGLSIIAVICTEIACTMRGVCYKQKSSALILEERSHQAPITYFSLDS